MGMSAEVLAVGPFRRSLLPFLGHPAERYAATREGATLVESVFRTPEGSSRSRQLAECLGIDPWDFNTHAFNPWSVDLAALRELFAGALHGEAHPVDAFVGLREAGFEFFFLPNG